MNVSRRFFRLRFALSLSAILPASIAVAGPRTSTHYDVEAETLDGGGLRVASVQYEHSGSFGGIVGVSSVASPGMVVKNGFLGQIADVIGLSIAAAGPTLNEGGPLQLSAMLALDDATGVGLAPNVVNWSVVTGPILPIGTGGLATAGTVYQDTLATVRGMYLGEIGTLNLAVLNIGADDFGTYASDALDDAWQVQYFGLDNPVAAPAMDPDGDGQSNAFEFAAGLAPNDPASAFQLRIEAVPDEAAQRKIVFSPRLEDRSYALEFASDLTLGPWTPLTGAAQADSGLERAVTDLDATGGVKFYRVLISKP